MTCTYEVLQCLSRQDLLRMCTHVVLMLIYWQGYRMEASGI